MKLTYYCYNAFVIEGQGQQSLLFLHLDVPHDKPSG